MGDKLWGPISEKARWRDSYGRIPSLGLVWIFSLIHTLNVIIRRESLLKLIAFLINDQSWSD